MRVFQPSRFFTINSSCTSRWYYSTSSPVSGLSEDIEPSQHKGCNVVTPTPSTVSTKELHRSELIERAIDCLIEIPTLMQGNLSQGGILDRTGRAWTGQGTCHAWVRTLSSFSGAMQCPNPEVAYFKWTSSASEASDHYLKFLLSDISPWASVMPRRGTPFVPEDYKGEYDHLLDQKFVQSKGVIFWHIDKLPANAQHQFLIAFRQSKQFPFLIKLWYQLVEQGYDPAWAYIWSSFWNQNFYSAANISPKRMVMLSRTNWGEYNFDTATSGWESILNFLNGQMDSKIYTKPYKENKMYVPVNQLWGPNHSVPKDQTCTSIVENTYKGQVGRLGRVASPFTYGQTIESWEVLLEEMIHLGKLVQKELILEKGLIPNVRKIA